MEPDSPFAALAETEVNGEAIDLQPQEAAAIDQVTETEQPEGVSDEVHDALSGKSASQIGAIINRLPPEYRALGEEMRREMQSRVDQARNEFTKHPANQLWGSLENDPLGTLKYMNEHYGYKPDGAAPPENEYEEDPLVKDVNSIKEYIQKQALGQQVDKAVEQIRTLSRQYEIETSDDEMEALIGDAAKNGWDVVKAFKAANFDKLTNRAAKPAKTNEQPAGEIDNVTARWNSWANNA